MIDLAFTKHQVTGRSSLGENLSILDKTLQRFTAHNDRWIMRDQWLNVH